MSAPAIRIFHNQRRLAMALGYRGSDTVTEVFSTTGEPGLDPLAQCAVAFHLFNVGDDPDFGPVDQRAVDYRARGRRSLSVGDVIAVGDQHGEQYFACTVHGFTPIDPPRTR